MCFFRDRAVATLLAMWMWRLLLLLLLQLISKEEKLNGFFLFFKAHLQYKKSEACFSFRCSLLASFLPSTSPNTTAKFRAGVQFYILQLLSHKGSHTHTGAGVSEWFTIKLFFIFLRNFQRFPTFVKRHRLCWLCEFFIGHRLTLKSENFFIAFWFSARFFFPAELSCETNCSSNDIPAFSVLFTEILLRRTSTSYLKTFLIAKQTKERLESKRDKKKITKKVSSTCFRMLSWG